MLPDALGLATLIERLGVTQNQVQNAFNIFRKSARQAGYFEHGEDRLVRPAAKLRLGPDPEPKVVIANTTNAVEGGHNETVQTHPLMVGLLRSLPALGEKFSERDRQRWLNAVKVNFDFMYGPAEEEAAAAPLTAAGAESFAKALDELTRDDATAT